MIIHPDDRALFDKMHVLAFVASSRFGLPLREFEPKRRPLPEGAYGLCCPRTGTVSVAFRWKHRASEGGSWFRVPVEVREVLETVAHELAHLRYTGHGADHKAFTAEILLWIKEAHA